MTKWSDKLLSLKPKLGSLLMGLAIVGFIAVYFEQIILMWLIIGLAILIIFNFYIWLVVFKLWESIKTMSKK